MLASRSFVGAASQRACSSGRYVVTFECRDGGGQCGRYGGDEDVTRGIDGDHSVTDIGGVESVGVKDAGDARHAAGSSVGVLIGTLGHENQRRPEAGVPASDAGRARSCRDQTRSRSSASTSATCATWYLACNASWTSSVSPHPPTARSPPSCDLAGVLLPCGPIPRPCRAAPMELDTYRRMDHPATLFRTPRSDDGGDTAREEGAAATARRGEILLRVRRLVPPRTSDVASAPASGETHELFCGESIRAIDERQRHVGEQ